jgi:hypothetical protein
MFFMLLDMVSTYFWNLVNSPVAAGASAELLEKVCAKDSLEFLNPLESLFERLFCN